MIGRTFTLLQFLMIVIFLKISSFHFYEYNSVIVLFFIPGAWALYEQKKFFSVFPEPIEGSELLVSGPYKYVRHPMYFSIVSFCLCVLVLNLSYLLFVNYIFIILILAFKIKREEKLLEEKFEKYAHYKSKTKSILPFII